MRVTVTQMTRGAQEGDRHYRRCGDQGLAHNQHLGLPVNTLKQHLLPSIAHT